MLKNIIWDFFGKFSAQLISFGISVLLTRLLSPAEFGVMGMAMAVIVVAHIFLDLGFNKAIIQTREISEKQYATIFYLNAGVAALLTGTCYLAAAPLARFYHQALIGPVFRVLSLIFLINGLNLVPAAILYKRLQFKLNSLLNIAASLGGGIIGVWMAYRGYGVWSLVAQAMLSAAIILLTNFIYARWWPVTAFSLRSIRPLWRYGSKMFASGLLDNVYSRLDVFIVGRIFNAGTLGYYTRAQSMDNFVRQFSVNSIMSGLFPYIARHQDDRPALTVLYRRFLHLITFVSVALSAVLFLTARPLFQILFTARWQYAADLFRLMSVTGFAWPVSSLMCNVIAGVGNSSAFLRLEVLKKLLFLPVYGFGFFFGLKGFLGFMIGANLVGVTLNALYASREVALTLVAQLRIIGAYFLSAVLAVLGAQGICVLLGPLPAVASVLLLGGLFMLLDLGLIYCFRLEALHDFFLFKSKLTAIIYDKRNKNISAAL